MDTLPEDIQKTIYKYKHQIEFTNVMLQLKCVVCHCGWCASRHWTWTECNCWQAVRHAEILDTRVMMEESQQKEVQVMDYYMEAGLSRSQAWLKWVEYVRNNPEFYSFDYLRY